MEDKLDVPDVLGISLLLFGGSERFPSVGIYKYTYMPVAVLSLLGIVGNIISLIVWTRPQLKSSSAILLTALAATDLVTVLIVQSATTLGIIVYFTEYEILTLSTSYSKFRDCIMPHVAVWVLVVLNIAQTASTYLTLAIALDRYIAVSRPFEFKMICTYSRACKSAASIIIFSILYNMCRFWERRLTHEDRDGNVHYHVVETQLRKTPLYISVYRIWLYLIINYLLPLAGTVILNTAVYIQLKIVNRERQTLTNLQKNENRLTRMLICVVVEFLVCTSVTGFVGIWSTFDGGEGMDLIGFNLTLPMVALSVFFTTFNSSVNFVTYVTYGGVFRKKFDDMFCCCCCKERAQPMLRRVPGCSRTNGTEDTLV